MTESVGENSSNLIGHSVLIGLEIFEKIQRITDVSICDGLSIVFAVSK
jgi:hypothetical protein